MSKRKSSDLAAASTSAGAGAIAPESLQRDDALLPSPPSPSAGAAAAPKKRRTTQGGNLTNAQKRALCVRFATVKSTQTELCAWARAEFQLPHLPHQSTISKILARAGELTTMAAKDLAARRRGFVTHPELDTALCNWVLFARQSGAKLSGDMIKDKARQLAQRLGLASKMTFSNGWLGGFKKRHNIRLGGTTTTTTSAAAAAVGTPSPATLDAALGGSADAVMNALAGGADPAVAFAPMNASVPFAVRELQECVKLYHASDVFAMSETGLYYALSPEKPAGRGTRTVPAATTKKETERFTIMLAANADGSERLEPFVIGSTKQSPRALQAAISSTSSTNSNGAASIIREDALHLQYRDNKKAWVTPVLFQEWVGLLDSKLRDEQRSILLLIAHAPAHIRIGLELTNVRLEVLPPSTTRQFQPFEAGIFDAFKRRYRRHHLYHVLDRFEAGQQDDIFRVDPVQALRWVRECWHAVPAVAIKHYWDATEITNAPKPSPQVHHAIEAMELGIENEIVDAVSALHIARPLTIDEYLSPSDESIALHCTGTDELDFIQCVGESPERDLATTNLATAQQRLTGADGEAGGALNKSGEVDAALVAASSSAAAAAFGGDANVGVSAASASGGSHVTNEQLLESLKVLLPELDRLRFDDHTKSSIRAAFRRLKDKESEQAGDAKQRQSATRRAMMVPSTSSSSTAAHAQAVALALAVPASVALTAVPPPGADPVPSPELAPEHTVI